MAESPVLRHSQEVEDFDVGDAKVQHYGLLMKKPFGHKSARWQKRFVYSSLALALTPCMRADERAGWGVRRSVARCSNRLIFATWKASYARGDA